MAGQGGCALQLLVSKWQPPTHFHILSLSLSLSLSHTHTHTHTHTVKGMGIPTCVVQLHKTGAHSAEGRAQRTWGW